MLRNKLGQFVKGHSVSEETKRKTVATRKRNKSYKPNKGSFKKGDKFWQGKKRLNISKKNHYNWKGGKYFDGRYIYILYPEHPKAKKDGYVAEHVLIMEKKLGRHLKKGELIHHKNLRKTDNHPQNLKLCKNISEHNKIHKHT